MKRLLGRDPWWMALIAIGGLAVMVMHGWLAVSAKQWDEREACNQHKGRVQCWFDGCRCMIPDGPWR